MSYQSLTAVKRRGVQDLSGLLADNGGQSIEAARKLIGEAKNFGLTLRDYLNLSIDVHASNDNEKYKDKDGFLSGYEATLAYLGLPVRNDFARGIVLDAANDTFQTYPGTRALFPEVVDDVVRWKFRQEQFEQTSYIVGSSRTIAGVEMITTIIDDKEEDYQVVSAVAEFGRVPVKSIRSTEQAVKFFKHGGGYRVSYEFSRRARIDMLAPFVNRMDRETERSKVRAATAILINGDGINGAAPVVAQSSFNTAVGGTAATNGRISYKHLLHWLVARARAGTPIDTVLGNWDAYIEWLMMFAVPTSNNSRTDAENLASAGFKVGGVPILNGVVNFALSSAAPAQQLVGFSQGDTLEELLEAGSIIEESERTIANQSINYVKTSNAGYKLAFSDTRSIYNYGA